MLIALFILLNIVLAAGLACLVRYWLTTPSLREDWVVLKNGFREGLKKCGLITRRHPYPVELYAWVTSNDQNVCEDCLRRSRLRPMDIAEWMKIGLPGTHESGTCCEDKCRCRLILHKKTYSHQG
ncbi:MAG: hypothetical protein COW13_04145 [Candidatus Omnitrophica bacterium CG12_big_fil_rev_8_21_14_0_65_50_5]|nr:MAG: hypothetical protein COW13_04145 [Candidatus Omnitrophica bacterium CG12_big_fil_rev_8_21_14_0_65_50_5]